MSSEGLRPVALVIHQKPTLQFDTGASGARSRCGSRAPGSWVAGRLPGGGGAGPGLPEATSLFLVPLTCIRYWAGSGQGRSCVGPAVSKARSTPSQVPWNLPFRGEDRRKQRGVGGRGLPVVIGCLSNGQPLAGSCSPPPSCSVLPPPTVGVLGGLARAQLGHLAGVAACQAPLSGPK